MNRTAHPQPIDPATLPPHYRADYERRNANIRAGKPLCYRCGGTGNELLSMYIRCTDCGGTGVKEDKR